MLWGCVWNVVFKYLQDVRKFRMLGEWSETQLLGRLAQRRSIFYPAIWTGCINPSPTEHVLESSLVSSFGGGDWVPRPQCVISGCCPDLHASMWRKGTLLWVVRWKKKGQRKEMLWRSRKDASSIYFPVFKVWEAARLRLCTLFCVATCDSGRGKVCSRAGWGAFCLSHVGYVSDCCSLFISSHAIQNVFFHFSSSWWFA